MSDGPVSTRIVFLGRDSQAGSYVLRLRLLEEVDISFGRFRGGKLVHLPAGEYAYIGSALATKGSVTLARRLVRHATRSGNRPPHPIREEMLTLFPAVGLGAGDLRPRKGKRLFWNIDHLLDLPSVELVGAFVLRVARRLETALGELLEADPHVVVVEKGLGANDVAGHTHVLLVRADEAWWGALPAVLARLL